MEFDHIREDRDKPYYKGVKTFWKDHVTIKHNIYSLSILYTKLVQSEYASDVPVALKYANFIKSACETLVFKKEWERQGVCSRSH